MPLPLIPIALGLASAATAIFGAKKGFDAKSTLDQATSERNAAAAEFDAEKERVDAQRIATDEALQQLGAIRLQASAGPMKRFVDAAQQVHHVQQKSLEQLTRPGDVETPSISELHRSAYASADLLKDGLKSVPAGVLTGAGAMGAVGWLGTASTGTAISSLSGVAATNATLAWLGGGSLAAGGWGVAGGTAVLGGVVAGPLLGAMGLAMASRMNKQATVISEQEAEYRIACEELRNAIAVLQALDRRSAEIGEAIRGLAQRFEPLIARLEAMVADRADLRARLEAEVAQNLATLNGMGWWKRLWHRLFGKRLHTRFDDPLEFSNFTDEDRQLYMTSAEMAYSMHALLKVRLLDEDGQPTETASPVSAQERPATLTQDTPEGAAA